ncbi:Aldose reductase [Armadillidium nasatum]|uniref:Aldose reductase n=1 Tax=Armadillidium nasatum TaxID=96803 RepID=A0A5N5SUS1_9CRUS|nr:Aldose reductase [Armadillidium nasatum]
MEKVLYKSRSDNSFNRNAVFSLLENPVVKLIADKHHVTPAQVLIRYCIEKEVVVIPRSFNEERMKCNQEVFNFALDETDKTAFSFG